MKCPECSGFGGVPTINFRDVDDCWLCGGSGEVPDTPINQYVEKVPLPAMCFEPEEVETLRELVTLLGDRWQKADNFSAAQALVKKITG